jgi:YD repeat-containing protein
MIANIMHRAIFLIIIFFPLISLSIAGENSSSAGLFKCATTISADTTNYSGYSKIVYLDKNINSPYPPEYKIYFRQIYDIQNRLIEKAYFNAQGNAIPMTQTSIGAWQYVYDDQGRIVEEGYYVPVVKPTIGIQTSEYYILRSVTKVSYNESGQRTKEIEYNQNGDLIRTILLSYKDGKTVSQFFNKNNIKVYETDNVYHLYFSEIDGGLIGTRGPISTDISLKNVWSKENNGFKCTIGLKSMYKLNSEINLYLTVANYSGHEIELKSTYPYKYLKPKLKKDGKIVPINIQKIEKRTNELNKMHNNDKGKQSKLVRSGDAGLIWGLNLNDWYDLDKGRYSLQVEINLYNLGINLTTPEQKFDIY